MAASNYKLFTKILAITLFTFLVSGSIWVIKNDNDKIVTKQNFELEKSTILKKLNRLNDSISIIVGQNSMYKIELNEQKIKLAGLIEKVSLANSGTVIKEDYSQEMANLKNEVSNLKNINANLLKINDTYAREIVALKTASKTQKNIVTTGDNSQNNKKLNLDQNGNFNNEKIANTASSKLATETADSPRNKVSFSDNSTSKILVSNLKTATYSVDKTGYMILSDKSAKANVVKVSFEISGNKNINFLYKEYYIQIIDSKNNVIGARKMKKFGSDELMYSAVYQLTFRNEPLAISMNVDLANEEKGTYYVNVFDHNKIMSNSSFVLK